MSAARMVVVASAGWLTWLAVPGLLLTALPADASDPRADERIPMRHERAPRPGRAGERRHDPADIGLHLDDDWLQYRWDPGHLEHFREDGGGPDVCRQPGRITWSTRQIPCWDRLPREGGRRWSTSPDD